MHDDRRIPRLLIIRANDIVPFAGAKLAQVRIALARQERLELIADLFGRDEYGVGQQRTQLLAGFLSTVSSLWKTQRTGASLDFMRLYVQNEVLGRCILPVRSGTCVRARRSERGRPAADPLLSRTAVYQLPSEMRFGPSLNVP